MSNEQMELESRCVPSGAAVEGQVSHTVPAAEELAPVPAAGAAEALTGEAEVAAPPVLPATAAEIAEAVAMRPDWAEDSGPVDRPVPARPPVQDGPFNTFRPEAQPPAGDVWALAVQVTGMASALVAGSHLLERYARPRVAAGPVISASRDRT